MIIQIEIDKINKSKRLKLPIQLKRQSKRVDKSGLIAVIKDDPEKKHKCVIETIE